MRKNLLVIILMLISAGGVMAQGITTAILTGKITDQKGEGVPGASILAVHTPTGTQFGVDSKADGRFTLNNLKVGGPYKITISFVGYKTQSYDDVYLKLAEPFTLNHTLAEESTQLNEIVVVAEADAIMNSNRNGAATNITSRQFLTLPSITRSINDMARLTPQATSTTTGAIGGGSYRQNNFTVDGADFNNTFGIGSNLPANGSPISLDAIEEMTISVTPYDVKQANFIGSSMNAVTRSGTNTFSGSAYMFFRNQGQQGDKVASNPTFTKQPVDVKTYGFRLGGPIIKNKLFFFINAESTNSEVPGQTNVASTGNPGSSYGDAPNIARPLASTLDTYSAYLKSTYGYETGPYQGYSFVSKNTRFVARVDWNINKNHRLNVRYSQVESSSPSFVSTSRSPFSTFNQTRTSIFALPYKNANYYQEANFYSFAAELNSSLFGGKYANTLRFTSTHQADPRSSDSKEFPFVDILDGTGTNTPYTSFGYEPFTKGNLRDVQSYSVVDYLTWTMGKHNLTAGIQFDLQTTKNGFQRYGTSYYAFNSWSDFVNGVSARDFAITYSLLPGYSQAYPRFSFGEYSVYAQDEYDVNDRVKVSAGLRIDVPTYLNVSEIKTHPLVAGLTFANGQTIDTGVLPENKVMWSPRIGFNWDVNGDRSMQVRGGSGIFTGRIPTVWIVAQSGDAGLLQVTQTWANISAANPGPNGLTSLPFNADPNAYRPTTQPTPGAVVPSSVSAMDRNLSFPQTWKTSIAVDKKLPYGIIGTLEAIYNKDLNVNYGRNPNLVDPQALNTTGYMDSRPIYPSANKDKFINPLTAAGLPAANGSATGTGSFNPIVLGNAKNLGYYFSITAKLEKQFASGLYAMGAYTFTEQQNLFDGTGDQLINTWSGTPTVGNPNNLALAPGGNIVPHRVIGSLSYRKEYFKHFATSVSLFFEGSTFGRYSYTYSADFNRDGQANDLIYVPKDPSEIAFQQFTSGGVTYTSQQQSDAFFAFIDQDEYLKTRKGQYAERNGAQFPWRNQIDIRFAQEIFTNIGPRRNTLQFTVDIFNFGNLLNSDWGIKHIPNTTQILQPQNVSSLVPGGAVTPLYRLPLINGQLLSKTFRDDNSINSTYYMQFGLRYTF